MDRVTPKTAGPPSWDEWFLSIYVDLYAEKHYNYDLSRVTDILAPGLVPSSHSNEQGLTRVVKCILQALCVSPRAVPSPGSSTSCPSTTTSHWASSGGAACAGWPHCLWGECAGNTSPLPYQCCRPLPCPTPLQRISASIPLGIQQSQQSLSCRPKLSVCWSALGAASWIISRSSNSYSKAAASALVENAFIVLVFCFVLRFKQCFACYCV